VAIENDNDVLNVLSLSLSLTWLVRRSPSNLTKEYALEPKAGFTSDV